MTVPVAAAVPVPPVPVGNPPKEMRDKVVCTTGSVDTGVPRVIPETIVGMNERNESEMKTIIVVACRLAWSGLVACHKHRPGCW